jgi:hypothetical protein
MYAHGQGVPQDFDQAFAWCRKSADQGYADGEVGLGTIYIHGEGVPQDYTEALRWYRKAADQGDPRGECALALMYDLGRGVPQDFAQAFEWYRQSANQGYPKAMYNLGYMYYYGHGVSQDRTKAVHLYQMAADRGDEPAQRALHIGWKGMSTIVKVALSLSFLASAFAFVSSLIPGGSFRGPRQRSFTAAALLGIAYVVSDLLGFRYLGILTPQPVFAVIQFTKGLLGGASFALLLSAVLPNSLWSKVAKAGIGVFGIGLVGFNLFVIAVPKLRIVAPALGSIWSMNAMLLAFIASLILVLWATKKVPILELNADSDAEAFDSSAETNRDEP